MRNNSKGAKAKLKAQSSVSQVKNNLLEAAKLVAELRRRTNWESLGFASFDQMMACQGIRNRIFQLRDALNKQPAINGVEPDKNCGGPQAVSMR